MPHYLNKPRVGLLIRVSSTLSCLWMGTLDWHGAKQGTKKEGEESVSMHKPRGWNSEM